MQSNAKYFVEFRYVASIYVQVHCAVMCMKHKCIGGQSGSEISYLFLRVVNIASVLLKKLPYGPLSHLPAYEKDWKQATGFFGGGGGETYAYPDAVPETSLS